MWIYLFIQLIKLKQDKNKIEIFTKYRNNHKKIYSLNDPLQLIKNYFNFICYSHCKCEKHKQFIFLLLPCFYESVI